MIGALDGANAGAWLALILSRAPEWKGEDGTAAQTAAAELPMGSEAFAGFYERSARSLWAYLARASGDAALADDLTQESFVRFLCAGRPDEGEVACRKYLFRIGTNLLRDHWRRPRSVSVEEFWTLRSEMSENLRSKLAKMPTEQVADVKREAIEALSAYSGDGGMSFPAEVLIVSGVKPSE